ncbi:MAG: nucleoside triphosphate pyrophosphohydrolase [Gammaproteobacteria bacterium TMED112]|nr:MAG: nucleoside triphosphate pyrophosphohydrolase [Gammaproteobacteria bacterium TMED112]|tara:strand:+ start:6734 stop:7513 length:780 start_codon:yes stop_codon:yes gene_type:complete
MNRLNKELEVLISTFKSLRNPDSGCAWDREQTFKSIASCAIEEAYEVADAIDREDFKALKSELGDLLFQVVFHAEMANEKGIFDLRDVITELNSKLVRRHPHVFSNEQAISAEESLSIWEDIKAKERKAQKLNSLMDDVPKNLPSLIRAKKLQKRAARIGFDWNDTNKVINKIEEELEELKTEHSNNNKEKIAEEVGDVLFTIVNLTRHYDLDPEDIMRRSNLKFEQRFKAMEKFAQKNNMELSGMSVEQLEEVWQKIK